MQTQQRSVEVTPAWEAAIRRAQANDLKPILRVGPDTDPANAEYLVPSISHPGFRHTVAVQNARIVFCTCRGWEHGGRSHPCRHAGAVARALAEFRGLSLSPATPLPERTPTEGVQPFRPDPAQIFRTER